MADDAAISLTNRHGKVSRFHDIRFRVPAGPLEAIGLSVKYGIGYAPFAAENPALERVTNDQ